TTGTLADLFGRRLLFSIGLALFAFTSLLCALSPSALFLIIARAAQGVGGAIMFSTSLALLAQEFHGRERGTALGIWGATIGGATAVGPLLGGILTEAFGWSSIFYINVPIGLVAAALTMTKVQESRNPEAKKVDWIGTITFTGGLFLLVLGLIRGNSEGWGSALIVSLFAASALLLVAFVVAETVQDNAMFDLKLFRKPTFGGASIAAFTLSSSMFAMFLYLTLYLQTILGLSPLQTGLRFLPVTVVAFAVSAVSGNLSARVPVRLLLGGGLGLVGGGLLLMRGLTADSQWTSLLAGFVAGGAGVGLVNPALASTAIGVVPPQRSGMASGINSTFRQVGVATGLAGTPVASHTESIAHAVAGGGAQQVIASIPASLRAQGTTAIHAAFAGAMNDILLVAGIIALTGAVLSLALVRGRDFVTYGARETAAAPAAG